ncbi:Crp/Fnr family transcriptional regulator [Schinkia sp. CFF1]
MYEEFLRGLPIFKDLPDYIMSDLVSKVKAATYKKGEYIFHEEDEAKAVFFVKSGIVKIKKSSQEGKEIVVGIKRSGSLFAENSLFTKSNISYNETAQTLEPTEVLYFLNSDLEEAIAINPGLSRAMIRLMGTELRFFTSTLRDLALLDVYSKTVKTLERLAREFGIETQNGIKIEIPLTVQELANIIGSTRESISRVISKLKKQDIITVEEKVIIINDWSSFSEMFERA